MTLGGLLYGTGAPTGDVDGAALAALAALLYVVGLEARDALGTAAGRMRDVLAGPEPSAIEQLQTEYAAGEIDLQEFERRAELALDDRAAVVAGQLKDVENVGPERAAAVAEKFGNIEAVRRADAEEIEEVHGVGPSTAKAITDEI